MSISESKLHILKLLELCVTIFRGPNADEWSTLATVGVPELIVRVQKNSDTLLAPIQKLNQLLTDITDEKTSVLETEYVRLFIAGPGGIPAPLYASCHLGTTPRTMGQSALDMQNRLQQAGLEISLDSNEPADHLTIELEFLFYLLSEGWFNQSEQADQGIEFAESVMLPWVRRFRDALNTASPHPVFACAADITVAMLEAVSKV
ncbi:molecular chaperone TorD family protein [uncultured Pseudodesulfovibrio sp.]|uniref:TorD/DmsD family molecular chaperone n=1 Tax=uncultured Pseudodesulfovibrio sp. TaxID=2035858 RepID=UPI0029C6A4FD|nr:molecular chaperone TorD family protein [uncultured Pseudodesulfovibrio sp.]